MERIPGTQEGATQGPGRLDPRPGCTWHEVSLEILLVAPPVLGVRCGSDVNWAESSLSPFPRYRAPPRPQGLLPRRQALPAAPSAAQRTSTRGALRRAAPPMPGRPLGDPFPVPGPPVSAVPSPVCGTLSLQDFQPPPLLPTGSPGSQIPRQRGTEHPNPLFSPHSVPLLLPAQPSSLPLPPDLSTPLSAFCFSQGHLLVPNPHPLWALFSLSFPKPPNSMSPFCSPHLLLLPLSLLCSCFFLSLLSLFTSSLSTSLSFSLSLSFISLHLLLSCLFCFRLSHPFLPPPSPLSLLFNFFVDVGGGGGCSHSREHS